MADFTAFFNSGAAGAAPPEAFKSIADWRREVLRAEEADVFHTPGASLLRLAENGRTVAFHADERGWIAVKGLIYDAYAARPEVSLPRLLADVTEWETADLNRYEGVFALVAWDAKRRAAIVVNDQAAIMNVYYAEGRGGFWVTTSPIPLGRALGIPLDPEGAREFFDRGIVMVPNSILEGVKRPWFGEHIVYREGRLGRHRHWLPYRDEADVRSMDEAAARVAAPLIDRFQRLKAMEQRVVADLTGGYDSRLTACAAGFVGLPFDATVNGEDDEDDVIRAKAVALGMGWKLHHFRRQSFWTVPIDASLRRELTGRVRSEQPFTAYYHQMLSRRVLARDYDLIINSVGGEIVRNYNFGQEFLSIGRRKRANVDNILFYRFLYDPPPPQGAFKADWRPLFIEDMRRRVAAVCDLGPGTLTTQQADAAFLLKMTGHLSLGVSTVYDWLPVAVPQMSAGMIDVFVSTPWRYRLTSLLERRIAHMLSPRVAAFPTGYGSTAGRPSLKTLHREIWQVADQARHLLRKLDQVALGGVVTKRYSRPPAPQPPYLTPEFRDFVNPASLYTRDLYHADFLDRVLGDEAAIRANERLALRMATLEQLCREIDFRPPGDLLGRPASG
ncbi:MAG: hypothetical protein C4523_20220 [Myxococcales bacterium]|nr:MAG: hypothetical protein C4523_20220 [Myxococcales bacterium]